MTASTRPQVLLFDVNETLSDTAGLATAFADAGLDESLAPLWFARILRDGFALTVTGDNVEFAELARALLRPLVGEAGLADPDQVIDRLVATFGDLSLHRDVAPALGQLANAGFRLVTLSNGSTAVTDSLLSAAGVRPRFERLLSVADGPAWKPASAAYRWAADQCGVEPAAVMLVAAHPWDVHGAAVAGLATAYLDRNRLGRPDFFGDPDVTVNDLTELVGQLS